MADPSAAERRSVAADVRWGVGAGLWFAAAYSVLAAAIFAARGSAPLAGAGLTLPGVVAAYFAGGAAGGALVGLGRPLLRWQVGAMLVGVLAAGPLALALLHALGARPSRADLGPAGGAALAALIWGVMFGNMYWKRLPEAERRD